MQESKVVYLQQKIKGNVTAVDYEKISAALKNADDEKFEVVNALKIKSKTVTVLLAIFLNVFARFYLGDIGFGIFRIIAVIVLGVLEIFPIVNIICGIALVVWYIVELVLCIKRVTFINYANIRAVLI